MNKYSLLTDHYELTMLNAALNDGTAERKCVFELFTRRIPAGRRYGVAVGLGRALQAIKNFRFDAEELQFLSDRKILDSNAIKFLENYKFDGSVRGLAEGELYFAGTPILQVEGTFADCVVLETLLLSIFNYDSAVAAAASRMKNAAGNRGLLEMGSRRANEDAAVAAARASYIAGFDGTSNLKAGFDFGIATIGTAAHAFTLLYQDELEAFKSQIATFGKNTTLLVDTYDVEKGIINAVKAAGSELKAIRLDSGDLISLAQKARDLLDSLGCKNTKITVTSDLDEYAIASLAASPVDSYGVGTSLVTGSKEPTCAMVYKLTMAENSAGELIQVAKKSESKATIGGYKQVYRILQNGKYTQEYITFGDKQKVETPPVLAGSNSEFDKLLKNYIQNGIISVDFSSKDAVQTAKRYHSQQLQKFDDSIKRLSKGPAGLWPEFIAV